MAGSVLRCEDLSGGMVTFDGAAGSIAVYMLTSVLVPSAKGSIPVVDFLGEHELR
jgi:hypothetical protein